MMAIRRLSISVTPELERAVRNGAASMDLDVSRFVETILREHPKLQEEIQQLRTPGPSTKKGRTVDKLLALGEVAEAQWEEKLRSGAVKVSGR